MTSLNYDTAHTFVEGHRDTRRWDGWDIVVWSRNPKGWMLSNGEYNRKLKAWGVAKRISPNAEGKWNV